MYEAEKQSLIDCALQMKAEQLIKGSGGNVSLRIDQNRFLVTPSAMAYETMAPEDICVVDSKGAVVEGKRRPTSDITAILYIFNHRPDIGAIIHTHQPYATALSLVCDELPADFVTVIDELNAAVKVAPFTRSSDEGMGVQTVTYAGDALAVILKHHGVIAFGRDVDEALSSAVNLEEGCRCYLAALATGLPMAHLTPEQIADEAEERGYYGQPKES